MKDVVVRPTAAHDLPRLSDLTDKVFGLRRSVELLAWLLRDPRCPQRITSWVAEKDGEVVGHTAVLKSRYRMNGRWATGAHAYLWMVDPDFRGRAGIRLGRRIVTAGDFLIILGGAPTTRAILAGRRFVQAMEAKEYLLLTEPVDAGGALSLVRRDSAFDGAARPPAGILGNEAAAEHLEWLARCPELEAHRFNLVRRGRAVGPVLLFVHRRTPPVAGRLVHLPYLGEEAAPWRAALAAIAGELARLGCRSWTLLATHPALLEACEAAGAEVVGTRPVWIKERQRVLSPGPWHLTYLEGDLAYRRVQSPSAARGR